MMHHLFAADPDMAVRPVQCLYLALAYNVLGQSATPNHLATVLLLGLMAILLYLALREFSFDRSTGFSIAAIFTLLPQYSTDRFWISAQQASLCLAFALAGIYALHRSARAEELRPKTWLFAAILAFALSILSYEVSLGLIAASIALVAWDKCRRAKASGQSTRVTLAGIAVLFASIVLLLAVKAHFQSRVVIHYNVSGFFSQLPLWLWNELVRTGSFNFWDYVLRLPAVLKALIRGHDLNSVSYIAAAAIGTFVAIHIQNLSRESAFPGKRENLKLIGGGLVLFTLGYMLFFSRSDNPFHTAGPANRITIAAAVGTAFTLVGTVRLASNLMRSRIARVRAFSLATGVICASYCLVLSGIASYWTAAPELQAQVLRSVDSAVEELPPRSTVLLDGFCRFNGPAPVFLVVWDFTSAMNLRYGIDAPHGDVLSRDLTLGKDSVTAVRFGQLTRVYTYSKKLFVYNLATHELTQLADSKPAADYARADDNGRSDCTDDGADYGRKIF